MEYNIRKLADGLYDELSQYRLSIYASEARETHNF